MLAALTLLAAAAIAPLAAPQESQADPMRVRVFIFSRSAVAQVESTGFVRERAGNILPAEVGEIENTLKSVQEEARKTLGKEIQFELLEDRDTVYRMVEGPLPTRSSSVISIGQRPENPTWDEDLLYRALAPYVNGEVSDRERATLYGPYSGILAIHAVPLQGEPDWTVNGMPLRMLPYRPVDALPGQGLANQIIGFLNEKAGLGMTPMPAPAPTAIPTTGGVKAERVGEVLTIDAPSSVRGSATIWQKGSGPAPGAMRLAFRYNAWRAWSVDLLDAQGVQIGAVYLGYLPQTPVEMEAGFPIYTLGFEPSDARHEVLIDLSAFPQAGQIASVRLTTDGPFSRLVGVTGTTGPLHIDRFEMLPSVPSGAQTFALAAPKPERFTWPGEQSNGAAIEQLKRIFDQGSTTERLSALYKLQTLKLPGSEEHILGRLRSGFYLEAALGAKALNNQEQVAARQGLSLTLLRGPFDFNRMFAAAELRNSSNSGILPAASAMMLSENWRPRVAAAELTMLTKAPESGLLVTAMMDDPNPCVRTAIVKSADLSNDGLARRILFAAVNDTSLWVRATAYARMLECPIPELFQEALRGVRDTSPFVKANLLRAMTDNPKPAYRESIPWGVLDEDASVRSQALRALAVQEGAVTLEEIEPAYADSSEAVQLALIDLAVAKSLTLPAEVLTRLKSSSHASVRDAAQKLGGSL